MLETIYLSHAPSRSFFELQLDDCQLRIRRGEMGKPCLVYHAGFSTSARAKKQYDRLHATWLENGLLESIVESPVIEGSVATEHWSDALLEHEVYGEFFELGWASDLVDKRERICVFENGLTVDGDFDLEEVADMGLCSGLIIDCDTRISGVFSQLSYTCPSNSIQSQTQPEKHRFQISPIN
jgi:hypothetical protein